MPRHIRVNIPGMLYFISCRGNNNQNIFHNKNDYLHFIELLRNAKQKYNFYVYTYVLLPNHFHLLIQIQEYPTSKIMQSILTAYTHYFNKKYKMVGHLFQSRYKSYICEKEKYAEQLIKYIHLNPLRLNIAKNLSGWNWSGHNEIVKKTKYDIVDIRFIEELFNERNGKFENYISFIGNYTKAEYCAEYHPKGTSPFLGSDKFLAKLNRQEKTVISNKPNLEEIAIKLAEKTKLKTDILFSKRRIKEKIEFRRKFILTAVLTYGYTQAEVSRYIGVSEALVSKIINKKED